jgi:hypothetical protein
MGPPGAWVSECVASTVVGLILNRWSKTIQNEQKRNRGTNMDNKFDELAKGLAQSVTRRQSTERRGRMDSELFPEHSRRGFVRRWQHLAEIAGPIYHLFGASISGHWRSLAELHPTG